MKKLLALLSALALCLSAAACGSSYEDSSSGSGTSYGFGKLLTDEDFAADVTAWQSEDGAQLVLDLPNGCYTYRTWYGRVGAGSLIHDDDDVVLLLSDDVQGECDYYLVQEESGFRPFHLGGQEGCEWGQLNGLRFEPMQEQPPAQDIRALDGVWQNALGYTLAFDTQRMRVIECDINDTMGIGALYDKLDGRGLFMGGGEILYPCVSADGNSLVLFTDGGIQRDLDSRSTGVFYRNGDMVRYAAPESACFETSDGHVWYYDGVHYFALPAGYTLREDGIAYDEAGRPFAPEWPDTLYDPAAVWGANWLEENWGSND